MDEDNFDKTRSATELEAAYDAVHEHQIHEANRDLAVVPAAPPGYAGPSFTNPRTRGEASIAWVRASDLLYSGSGRVAGRGLDFETFLARRVRQTPAVTRRAIRERADRLPPLSEFGASSSRSSFTRFGPGLQ
jgi:hypothetical protein